MDNRRNRPFPIAHRGCSDTAPENTIPAFDEAVRRHMGGVEIDISMTKDGEIIVFHDDTPERLTFGFDESYNKKKISDLTLDEVKQIKLPYAGHLHCYFPEGGFPNEVQYYYPWAVAPEDEILAWERSQKEIDEEALYLLFEQCKGRFQTAFQADDRTESIPTLEEFLMWLKHQPQGFIAEIEYKSAGMTPKVAELLEKTETENRCILFSGERSFNDEMQAWFHKNGKPNGLRLGANIRFCTDEILESIQSYDLYEVGLNAGCFGAEEVEKMNARDICVFSNLGDVPKWWKTMQDIGVEAFKTNTGKEYQKWFMQTDTVSQKV